MTRYQTSREKGFTIVELMIATAVLSTILVTISIIMISLGNLYYKGVNQARIQDAARTITDEVSQRLEFDNQTSITHVGPSANGTQAYCIGTTRYTYVVGMQLGTKGPGTPSPSPLPFQHILWRDSIHAADDCTLANLTASNPSTGTDVGAPGNNATNGTELVPPSSRLVAFSISPTSSPFTVNVSVAYGDDDLLCNPSVTIAGKPSCSIPTTMPSTSNFTDGNLQCKGSVATSGSQFCSIADLSTIVVQRLTPN